MTSAPATAAEPVGYVLHHRTGAAGSRWAKVLETCDYAEVAARVVQWRGRGELRISYVYRAELLSAETRQPGLFE